MKLIIENKKYTQNQKNLLKEVVINISLEDEKRRTELFRQYYLKFLALEGQTFDQIKKQHKDIRSIKVSSKLLKSLVKEIRSLLPERCFKENPQTDQMPWISGSGLEVVKQLIISSILSRTKLENRLAVIELDLNLNSDAEIASSLDTIERVILVKENEQKEENKGKSTKEIKTEKSDKDESRSSKNREESNKSDEESELTDVDKPCAHIKIGADLFLHLPISEKRAFAGASFSYKEDIVERWKKVDLLKFSLIDKVGFDIKHFKSDPERYYLAPGAYMIVAAPGRGKSSLLKTIASYLEEQHLKYHSISILESPEEFNTIQPALDVESGVHACNRMFEQEDVNIFMIDSLAPLALYSPGQILKGGVATSVFNLASSLQVWAETEMKYIFCVLNTRESDPTTIERYQSFAMGDTSGAFIPDKGSSLRVTIRKLLTEDFDQERLLDLAFRAKPRERDEQESRVEEKEVTMIEDLF